MLILSFHLFAYPPGSPLGWIEHSAPPPSCHSLSLVSITSHRGEGPIGWRTLLPYLSLSCSIGILVPLIAHSFTPFIYPSYVFPLRALSQYEEYPIPPLLYISSRTSIPVVKTFCPWICPSVCLLISSLGSPSQCVEYPASALLRLSPGPSFRWIKNSVPTSVPSSVYRGLYPGGHMYRVCCPFISSPIH